MYVLPADSSSCRKLSVDISHVCKAVCVYSRLCFCSVQWTSTANSKQRSTVLLCLRDNCQSRIQKHQCQHGILVFHGITKRLKLKLTSMKCWMKVLWWESERVSKCVDASRCRVQLSAWNQQHLWRVHHLRKASSLTFSYWSLCLWHFFGFKWNINVTSLVAVGVETKVHIV